MTASTAASTVRSNSMPNTANTPTVTTTSCTVASTEPSANFFSKRTQT